MSDQIRAGIFEVCVGRIMCGTVRGILERFKFNGLDIEWHESDGIIERVFAVKGKADDVLLVHKALKELE